MFVDLLPFQYDFQKRYEDSLVIVSAGVSSGKSRVGALFLVQELLMGKRVLCGAQTFSALKRVMFREIEMFLQKINAHYHLNKSDMTITHPNGGTIFGFSNENPTALLGMTDMDSLLIDEAGYCDEDTYNFAKDRLRGEHVKKTKTRLISSPDNSHAAHRWFIDLMRRKPEAVIYASALDNKFTSDEFKADLIDRYPEGTALYEQQILGHIVNGDLMNAIIRECDYPNVPCEYGVDSVYIGVDPAGCGRDATCFIVRNGSRIIDKQKVYSGNPSDEIAMLRGLALKYRPVAVAVDDTGGFAKHFRMVTDLPIAYVNFGGESSDANYANKRCQMYFQGAKRIKEGFYVDDKDIREQLHYTQYEINRSGKTILADKELIKKSLGGRSPDDADALMLSFEAETNKTASVNVKNVAHNLIRALC